MKIIVDGMGGDHAPAEILKGCAMAAAEWDVDLIVTGPESVLKQCAAEQNICLDRISFADAEQVISMEDEPLSVVKEKRNSSLGVAMDLLKDGAADALVSAGNSGAILSGGTLIVRRIKGVKRAAFGATLPTKTGYTLLMDSGATVDCRPEFLYQYGLMGSIYMKHMFGLGRPEVGLANNGAEESKGTDLYVRAYQLLKSDPNLHFIGNVEGRGIMQGECRVLVADGFTGNLILKTVEGTALYLMKTLKGLFLKNLKTKIAALLVKDGISELKNKMDYKEVGGAPLIGTQKPIIKAHGSSDARAIKNAIRQAKTYAQSHMIQEIADALAAGGEQDV